MDAGGLDDTVAHQVQQGPQAVGAVVDGRALCAPVRRARAAVDDHVVDIVHVLGLGVHDAAQPARVYQVAPLRNEVVVAAVLAHHVDAVAPPHRLHQACRFLERVHGGYLAEDVLARFQGGDGLLGVDHDRRGDDHHVDRRVQQVGVVREQVGIVKVKGAANRGQAIGVEIAQRGHRGVGIGGELAGQAGSPRETDEPNAPWSQRIASSLPLSPTGIAPAVDSSTRDVRPCGAITLSLKQPRLATSYSTNVYFWILFSAMTSLT